MIESIQLFRQRSKAASTVSKSLKLNLIPVFLSFPKMFPFQNHWSDIRSSSRSVRSRLRFSAVRSCAIEIPDPLSCFLALSTRSRFSAHFSFTIIMGLWEAPAFLPIGIGWAFWMSPLWIDSRWSLSWHRSTKASIGYTDSNLHPNQVSNHIREDWIVYCTDRCYWQLQSHHGPPWTSC